MLSENVHNGLTSGLSPVSSSGDGGLGALWLSVCKLSGFRDHNIGSS